MPTPIEIQAKNEPDSAPLWIQRGWNPDGRPSGLRDYIVLRTDGQPWLWSDQTTAREVARALASETAAQLQTGRLEAHQAPKHRLSRVTDDDRAEFWDLAVRGELDLLIHVGAVVGFLYRATPMGPLLIPRLNQIKVRL